MLTRRANSEPEYPGSKWPNVLSVRRRAQRPKQRLGGFLEEQFLRLAADLDERDIGETGFPVRPHGVHDRRVIPHRRARYVL